MGHFVLTLAEDSVVVHYTLGNPYDLRFTIHHGFLDDYDFEILNFVYAHPRCPVTAQFYLFQ